MLAHSRVFHHGCLLHIIIAESHTSYELTFRKHSDLNLLQWTYIAISPGYPQLSIHCNTSHRVLEAYERIQYRGIKLIWNSTLAYRNTHLYIILKVNCFLGDRYSQVNTESNTYKSVHCVYFGSGTEFHESYKIFVFSICVSSRMLI